jgi:hypothetical protein
MNKKYGSHRSWVVESILNCAYPEWRLIMKLALTPRSILLAYDRNREISSSFCDKYLCPGYLDMLRFYLNLSEAQRGHRCAKYEEITTGDALNNEFFILMDNVIVKQYMAERKLFREQFVAKLDAADRL